MNKNRSETVNSYPFDCEDFDLGDFQTLARQKLFLKIAITDFHHSEDKSEKEDAREMGRKYISDLQLRESMKVALQCWYDERIARVA